MPYTANNRIQRVHQELGDIIENPGMCARLPQALMVRLKAMQGMLMEEMKTNTEAESHRELLDAARPQDTNAKRYSISKIVH